MSVEYILTNYYKDEMISYIMSHPEDLEDLIELALSVNKQLSSSAAWLLSHCVEDNDSRITKYIPQIINALETAKGGQQSALIYILRKTEITEQQEGLIFSNCVEIWCKLSNIPSARYNALIYIIQIAKKYPELVNEVTYLLRIFIWNPFPKELNELQFG